MQEFDLEGGIKPIERPKLKDFCAKCRLEVLRSVKICPRCGFDIDGFRNLDGNLPVIKPRAPAAPTAVAPAPKKVALAIAGAVLVVAVAVAWWAFHRPQPVVQPVVGTLRAPARGGGCDGEDRCEED